MTNRSFLAMTAAGLLAAAPALAQVSATTTANLNLRAGPGGNQQVLTVIPANGQVTVQGCLEAANWCQVDFQGTQGWAYGEYLNTMMADRQVVVVRSGEPTNVGTVTYDMVNAQAGTASLTGAATGVALASALIGGPAAIAAGALLGAATSGGDMAPVLSFMEQNPVQPIQLGGDVVVGAGIPQGVQIVEVPNTNYGYLNANGVPVIVSRDNGRIVHILRD